MNIQDMQEKDAEGLQIQKPEVKAYLGIRLKKDATVWNLFAIFYVFFLMTSIGGYINVQIVYLLRDPTYFSMDEDKQGRTTSNILFVAIICGLCFTPIAGYNYDIFGRKIPIFMAVVIGAFFLFLSPHTSPSIMWLTFCRASIQISLATIGSHPLIMDYIKQESRGKAAAIQNMGNLIGETFAMSVLFGYSKREDVSQTKAFCVAAIIIGVLSLFILCLVRNPKIKESNKKKSEVL